MSIGEGSARVFLERPVSVILIVIVVAVLLLPRLYKRMAGRAEAPAAA
jgi:putative tricarboxylic transport membrane protein